MEVFKIVTNCKATQLVKCRGSFADFLVKKCGDCGFKVRRSKDKTEYVIYFETSEIEQKILLKLLECGIDARGTSDVYFLHARNVPKSWNGTRLRMLLQKSTNVKLLELMLKPTNDVDLENGGMAKVGFSRGQLMQNSKAFREFESGATWQVEVPHLHPIYLSKWKERGANETNVNQTTVYFEQWRRKIKK